MTYDPQDADSIATDTEQALRDRLADPALDEVDVLGAIVTAVAETLADNQEQALANISEDAYLLTASGDALERKTREYGITRRDAVRATGVVEFQRDTPAPTNFTIPSGQRVQTPDGTVAFETTEQVTLSTGTESVRANARAVTGGAEGNLPANRLTVIPSPPSGVPGVTNPNPTGDPTLTDTDGSTLIAGRPRETDAELRERTLDAAAIGGAATPGAIQSALLELDGVRSVSIFSNPTNSTGPNGLPPFSNEVIVSGGDQTAIARTLRDTVSVTELFRLQGGIVGNGVTVDTLVQPLDRTVSVSFARPTQLTLSIEAGVVTTDNYIGETAIANRLVDYVGGTEANGASESGLGAGEDVLAARLRDIIVGPDTGVQGIDPDTPLTVDLTGDGTNDLTQRPSDGLHAISVDESEQAILDAADVTLTEV